MYVGAQARCAHLRGRDKIAPLRIRLFHGFSDSLLSLRFLQRWSALSPAAFELLGDKRRHLSVLPCVRPLLKAALISGSCLRLEDCDFDFGSLPWRFSLLLPLWLTDQRPVTMNTGATKDASGSGT